MAWTLAQKPAGPAKVAMFVVRRLLNLAFRRFLTNLRRSAGRRRKVGDGAPTLASGHGEHIGGET